MLQSRPWTTFAKPLPPTAPDRTDLAVAEPGRNVIELIMVRLSTLRKSDRRVAEHILSNPHAALTATVAATARAAGVSEPTVMRFCAALGFDGFQDFKLRLAHSMALGVPATQSVLHEADTPRALADKVFDYAMTSLDWARTRLDHQAVGQAIDLLVAAKRIEFFGFGASWIVAADAQQKFPLFGVPCLVHTRFAPAVHRCLHDAARRRRSRHLEYRPDRQPVGGDPHGAGDGLRPSSAFRAVAGG